MQGTENKLNKKDGGVSRPFILQIEKSYVRG